MGERLECRDETLMRFTRRPWPDQRVEAIKFELGGIGLAEKAPGFFRRETREVCRLEIGCVAIGPLDLAGSGRRRRRGQREPQVDCP